MAKDWFEWHDLYQTDARLQQRLEIVREYITRSLDAIPSGQIQVVSACAGDGRDLLGVLSNHPRAQDVQARLVELNPQLVERGRAAIEAIGLTEQIEFINGDATLAAAYSGAVPADIVIVCGIFGNLANEAELQRLIRNLSYLSKSGTFVLWTRGHLDGVAHSETVRRLFQEAGFEEVDFRLTQTGDMGVGIHRYSGENTPVPSEEQLFEFSGKPDKYQIQPVH